MKLRFCSSSAFVIGAAAASAALAVDEIHWITDARNCSANFAGNGSGSSWNDPSLPFDLFQGAADILATNGIETWTAHCTQYSHMDGDSASFDAWATGNVRASMASNPLLAQSIAKFDVWFSIDAPMEYHLGGLLTASGYLDSAAFVRLTSLDGTVIDTVSSVLDTARGFRHSGVIQPGTYRLYAEAKGRCRTLWPIVVARGDATCTMEFSVNAVLPEAPPVEPRPTMTSSGGAPRRPS